MEAIRLGLLLTLCLGFHRSSTEILKRQKRDWIIDSYTIKEGYKGKYPYDLGKIEIEKNFTFYALEGQGFDKDPVGILKIDRDTGMITVWGPVDYEKHKVLKLAFQAHSSVTGLIDTRLGIDITIEDANDNPPKFSKEKYVIPIKEATKQGSILTTVGANDADSTEENKLFTFKIVSVTPKEDGLQFFLKQTLTTAIVSFKGCLDFEKAESYTIVVEAKDQGKEIQLSSTSSVIINIEDGNNHLPQITGQTGPGRLDEGQVNKLVSRIQVTDADSKGSTAWQAKYTIHGDTDDNFEITTDPKTNEGLLVVKKPLDHEESQTRNLTISVENVIPYASCKVVSRSSTGLWKVVTGTVATASASEHYSTRKVTVIVDDVNEPPAFTTISKRFSVVENCKVGTYLGTLTAKDPDTATPTKIEYKIGNDPAGWISVDSKTGKITTKKIIDRESKFIKNSYYNVTVNAVDDGKPQMTGTATVFIRVGDENDNPPTMPVTILDMCNSDRPYLANITALDPDAEPYGGPFSYKLQEKDKSKWKIEPIYGFTVNLVKGPVVQSGHYKLMLEVSDLQGTKALHNLSVTVCNCPDLARPNCRMRRAKSSSIGAGGIGIIFFGILMLAGLLLLVFLLSCKKKNITIPDGESGQHLMSSNIEKQGTDCKVAYDSFNKGHIKNEERIQTMSKAANMKQSFSNSAAAATVGAAVSKGQSNKVMSRSEYHQERRDYVDWSMGASSTMRNQQRNFRHGSWGGHGRFASGQVGYSGSRRRYFSDGYDVEEDSDIQRATLLKALNKMLSRLQTPGEELGDYPPHVYAEEGGTTTNFQLDAISIPDVSFDPDSYLDLDNRFKTLASVCMQSRGSANTTRSSAQTVSNTVSHSDLHGKPKMKTPSQLQF